MKHGILIPTCTKYREIAEWTASKIEHFWSDRPEIRFCGVAEIPGGLPLRDDERNWMRVMRSACDDLIGDGWEAAYVILDDHPPLGPCHAGHLNQTLPRMVSDLSAVSISLSGWGQGRKRLGQEIQWHGFRLDRCLPETLWKYPLHPALWRLAALREILDSLIEALPEDEQTPWAFERKGGAADAPLRKELKSASFRIEGKSMAAVPYPERLRALRFATDLYRYAVRKILGSTARAAVDQAIIGVHHYYHGPYPLFWSGIMRKGTENPDYQFFSRLMDWPGCEPLSKASH